MVPKQSWWSVLFLLAACGGAHEPGSADGGPSPGSPDADSTDGGTPVGDDDLGGEIFVVAFNGAPLEPSPAVWAAFFTTAPSWHTETFNDGSCRVLAYELGFCGLDCPGSDGVCLAPDRCVPYPDFQSAGLLEISGLELPLQLDPVYPMNSYHSWGGLPDLLFASDAQVSVTAAGADIPAFSLSARAVPRLTGDLFATAISVSGDSDYVLDWNESVPDARVRVTLNAGNSFATCRPASS